MDRKTLILCLSVLAVMILGLGVAVGILYSGEDSGKQASSEALDESRYLLLPAVPSDAVTVACMSDADETDGILLPDALSEAAGSVRCVVSMHHTGAGKLSPLYIFDAGRTSSASEKLSSLVHFASENRYFCELVDCSSFPEVNRHLSNRSILLISHQENLVKSSVRHLQEGVSVMDAPGFSQASGAVSSNDVLFIANEHIQRLLSTVLSKKYSRYSPFFSRFARWTVFDVSDDDNVSGSAVYEKDRAEFMGILEASHPVTSSLSSVLPSYTVFAATLSMKDADSYLAGYEGFVDSKQELARYRARQNEFSKASGMTVEDIIRLSGVEEIARASFKVSGKIENINLMKVGRNAVSSLFAEELDVRDYVPAVHEFKYSGFLSSVFGKLFELQDESCFTYAGGWIISGSRAAINEYIGNNALEYTLKDQMKDAGQSDLLASVPSVFQAYFSFTEDKDFLREIFIGEALPYVLTSVGEYDWAPMVLRVAKTKKKTFISAELVKADVKRTKAPETERDTTVVIPQGPFEVMNSGTGKLNNFYQNKHLSLCLSQDGKDLWGIPFKEKLCGYANTVDYYANGKLQILFGAGSRMYLIDRLGRFVNGFPVNLGKEILLGPQPYDFNGTHKYSAVVLHKDNTIEMYNLRGQKPEAWKGIKVEETIKSLPEIIDVGGKSFWIVRTSIQTLIFPFVGGDPVTEFEGDKKIRPDSPVTVLDVTSVEVECYDGRKRTVKLK